MTRGPPASRRPDTAPMAIRDRETVHCSQSSGPTGKVGIGKVAVRDTPHANGILPHSTPDFKSTRVRAGNSHLNVTLGWIRKMGGAVRQFGEGKARAFDVTQFRRVSTDFTDKNRICVICEICGYQRLKPRVVGRVSWPVREAASIDNHEEQEIEPRKSRNWRRFLVRVCCVVLF